MVSLSCEVLSCWWYLKMKTKDLLIFCFCFLVSCKQELFVEKLTCEYHVNPIAIETSYPKLSWQLKSDEGNIYQQAYRILVTDQKELLEEEEGNIWDSGIVESGQSVQVLYAGKKLEPYQTYYWKVKIWDQKGRESAWSKISQWRQMPTNPKMNWIGFTNKADTKNQVSSIWFRKTFHLENLPEGNVYAEVATPGYYELYINGKKVGLDVLSPSVSGKDKRTFYVTYDIGPYLQKGINTVGIWLAKGWYGVGPIPVAFHCEISQNGDFVVLNSDASWKAAVSNYSTLGSWDWAQFGGECCNAEKRNTNWNLPDFDDYSWESVDVLSQPSPVIEAQPCELNRANVLIQPQCIKELDFGCYEIDFGKNLTGNYRVKFPPLQKGDTVRMYFADVRWDSAQPVQTPAGIVRGCGIGERLFTCGRDTFRYSTHNQYSMFIASGKGNEEFISKFNPLGFRYIVIEGLKESPLEASAYLVETDLARIGSFDCSDSLLMRMHDVNDWTLRCLNQGAVYVDCPTRERLGYGDGQVSVESSIMNYYMPNFYRKFVKDWILRQDSISGAMPNVAPNYFGGGGLGWPGIVAAIAWRNYLYYADKSLLEYSFIPMQRYLNYIESQCADGIYRGPDNVWNSIGDWLAPDRGMDTNRWPNRRQNDFFNNCYRVILWRTQLKAAQALFMQKEIDTCTKKIKELSQLIHEYYYDKKNEYYVSDEQTYLLMPLVAGIVPDALKERIKEKLFSRLSESYKIGTGMLGTYFLIQYLQENDCNDLLYKIVAHKNYPGWGYMLSQGATTWWEQWNGYWSQIHSCFTSLDGWFYQGIAGIRPDIANPGMKKFILKPAFIQKLKYAKAEIESMYGKIESFWQRKGEDVVLRVEIPCNSSALLILPSGYYIEEGNSMINCRNLHSGKYLFVCKKNKSC